MTSDTEVLFKVCQENWTQSRHIEDQRATVTNLVIIITSVILGFITQKGVVLEMLPLTILLIVLGLYGAIASQKLYERFRFHSDRARCCQEKIAELNPGAQVNELYKKARNEHKQKYPRLSKLRMHHLWVILHLAITVAGIVLSTIVLL